MLLRTHAASIALHAGVILGIGLIVPTARSVFDIKPHAVEIRVIEAPSPTPVPPPPVETPAVGQPRPTRVPAPAKMAMMDKPRPFQEGALREGGATSNELALPAPTTPLPGELTMESIVGTDEYVTTSRTGGTMGVMRGSGAPGGLGGGRGAFGPLGNQVQDLEVSRDWEITRLPEPINDDDFTPTYPPLARKEGRDGVVVLALFIDAEGRVNEALVSESAGHGFDESAVAYARMLRFEPARSGETPVASKIEWTVRFYARD